MKVSDMTQRHFRAFDRKSDLENYKVILRIPALKHLRIGDGKLSVSLLWLWLRFPATQTRADMNQRNFLDYIGTGKFGRQGGNREEKASKKEEIGEERWDGRSLWRKTFSRGALAKFWKSHSKLNSNFQKAEIVFCKFSQISYDLTPNNLNLQSCSNDYEKMTPQRIKSYCHMISSWCVWVIA